MRRWIKQTGLLAALTSFSIGYTQASADAPAVPAAFLGVWASKGHCSDPRDTLVVTAATAALGNAKPAPIVYAPDDDGAGHGALHWAEEGEVDNFVLMNPGGPLIYNPNGYGMPGQVAYERCGR